MKLFFIIIAIYFVYANIQILQFTQPNNYILTAKDYAFSDNIIVEIWGAGSGGAITKAYKYCDYTKNECYAHDIIFNGGSSGSFISANIVTYNQSFNIVVGQGGISCRLDVFDRSSSFTCTGTNGGSSTFSNNNINLIATGGQSLCSSFTMSDISCRCSSNCLNSTAKPIIALNTPNGYLINSADSNLASSAINEFINGADAPFTTIDTNIGSGAYCCPNVTTNGNNGSVIIYFNSPYSPSASIKPTPSKSTSCSKSLSTSKSDGTSRTVNRSPSTSPSTSPSSSSDTTTIIITIVVVSIIIFCGIICCIITTCFRCLSLYSKYEKI